MTTEKKENDNEADVTFNIAIDGEKFVIPVMPTQDRHSSQRRSAVPINSIVYKLRKPNKSQIHKLVDISTFQIKKNKPKKVINL